MADVHRITAARRFVDWDPQTVCDPKPKRTGNSKINRAERFVAWSAAVPSAGSKVPQATPTDAKEVERLIAADQGVSMQCDTSPFIWIFARSTLGESGLRRWSIRLHHSSGAVHALGLTRHSPAHADRILLDVLRSAGPQRCSDGDTFTFGTFYCGWLHQNLPVTESKSPPPVPSARSAPSISIDTAVFEEAQRRGRPLTKCAELECGRVRTDCRGMTFTFEVDDAANTVRAQYHRPACGRDEDSQRLPTPSEVIVLALPADMPVSAFRPVLMLWGPATYVDAEVTEFPRFEHD
jgi:hypothetical protein